MHPLSDLNPLGSMVRDCFGESNRIGNVECFKTVRAHRKSNQHGSGLPILSIQAFEDGLRQCFQTAESDVDKVNESGIKSSQPVQGNKTYINWAGLRFFGCVITEDFQHTRLRLRRLLEGLPGELKRPAKCFQHPICSTGLVFISQVGEHSHPVD